MIPTHPTFELSPSLLQETHASLRQGPCFPAAPAQRWFGEDSDGGRPLVPLCPTS